ncbi:rare lipoprotein A precursor [Blastochloris viridis]|uniref:Endolytic peptidoglycan transglycosylase RlpA n=1 Tax=Blastochloris viridis TaxID=1079 RepID=A0A182D4A9_BLAVI|nr:rare lipoprotein A precursor [Blastochloris viridis]
MSRNRLYAAAIGCVVLAASSVALHAEPQTNAKPAGVGAASFYGHNDGHHGGRTANGERFDRNSMTAAHRSLPFGAQVRVTNLRNGRAVVVRINNRGPFIRGRIIDLSYGAARELGFVDRGVTQVRIERLS